MSIREDLKSVLSELSPILAGFKLAVIIISWFGFGSVASWIVGHWYPFTRWVWDQVAIMISLPTFPDVVKDSLTALVFFLPLGVSALFKRDSSIQSSALHRFLGAMFGIGILLVICKDVISEIIIYISSLDRDAAESPLIKFINNEFYPILGTGGLALVSLIAFIAYILFFFRMYKRVRKIDPEGVRRIMSELKRNGIKASLLTGFTSIGIFVISFVVAEDGISPISLALAILFIIISLMSAAIAFVPRKLFIATGASLAFIAAALCFELAVFAISFIETTAT